MIEITRLKGDIIMINPDLIEVIEETPDTVITLVNGKKYIASESSREIRDRIIDFRRKIYAEKSI